MKRYLTSFAFLSLALVVAGIMPPAGAAAPGPDGETIFRQRCSACHSVVPSQPKTLAPSLNGVVGRKAASTAFNYSAALKGSGLTWSKPNLDRFLTAPTRMVPGTRMVIAVPDAAQRAALIGYLETRK